jgi:hypothetical protein
MNIIEKLGVKLKSDGRHEFKSESIYQSVRNAASEMLEALIEEINLYYDTFGDVDGDNCEHIQRHISVIEKATGKTWEEIKDLMD